MTKTDIEIVKLYCLAHAALFYKHKEFNVEPIEAINWMQNNLNEPKHLVEYLEVDKKLCYRAKFMTKDGLTAFLIAPHISTIQGTLTFLQKGDCIDLLPSIMRKAMIATKNAQVRRSGFEPFSSRERRFGEREAEFKEKAKQFQE